MRSCLCTSTCTDVILNLNTVLAENLQAFDELFVLFLSPSPTICIYLVINFTLIGTLSLLQLRKFPSETHGLRETAL